MALIRVPQPAMALNSHDVPKPHYRMWNTWAVAADVAASHIVAWVKFVATHAPNGKLKALVLNCHGGPGYLIMGTGLYCGHVPLFSQLKGLVEVIYITACEVADTKATPKWIVPMNGPLFCGGMAKETGAHVYAGSWRQLALSPFGLWLPYGSIDAYEGPVYHWDPSGAGKLDLAHTITDMIPG